MISPNIITRMLTRAPGNLLMLRDGCQEKRMMNIIMKPMATQI